MILKTERLNIRYIKEEDWESIKEIWKNFNASRFAKYDAPHPTEDKNVRAIISKWANANGGIEHMFFAVCLEDAVIGYIVCNIRENGYEIGYCFHSDYHGKGYAKESHLAIFKYLRELGITRLFAGTALNNTPSVALLKSLGFKQVGREKVSFYKDAEGNDIEFDGGIFELKNEKMVAETDRLILRKYKKSDLHDLYEYLSDAEVVKYEPYKPMSISEVEENLDWRISADEMIAVELKSNNKMIGNVYLGKRDFESLEIGYVFHRQYWGQGYAKESCMELIKFAFSNGIHRIYAECDPDNIASWRLLESLGFEREAHLKKNVYFWRDKNNMPIWKDTFIYAKLSKKEREK